MKPLSLSVALAEGRLEEFIVQAEARDSAPVSNRDFDNQLGRLITAPPPEGQTSRLRAHGGSRGK